MEWNGAMASSSPLPQTPPANTRLVLERVGVSTPYLLRVDKSIDKIGLPVDYLRGLLSHQLV
jgi:hypothetical protein